MRRFVSAAAALCCLVFAPGAPGQPAYPEKPVKILVGGTPAEFAAVVKAEIPAWAKVIREAGIKPAD